MEESQKKSDGIRRPQLFTPHPGESELDTLLSTWAASLSNEEREDIARILRFESDTDDDPGV